MPISITCSACSSSFSVKDECAGKRAKCPKCAASITIPAAEAPLSPASPPVAAPVLARPVVATRVPPKPTADEDAPVPKRRRGDDDEDDKPAAKRRGKDEVEDDKPAEKRRKGGDEDDDDKPKRRKAEDDDEPKGRRRRRDDDDEPKKKGKALPIILGVVGGLLLLCGGGCAGIYFGVIAPAAAEARARISQKQAELNRFEQQERSPPPPSAPQEGDATEENLRKVRAGMTADEVQAILGLGLRATRSELPAAVAEQPDPADATARWTPKVDGGFALAYIGLPSAVVLVLYSPGPNDGGTVVAAIGSFGDRGIEPIRLPSEAKVPPPPTDQPVTLIADQLSDRMAELKDKTVIVTGKVEFASNAAQGGSITLARSRGKKSVGAAFTAAKWHADWAGKKMQPGDEVTIKGVVGVDPTGVGVLVKDCELLAHSPATTKPDDRTPIATLTPEELGLNYAQMKDKWITLKGQYKSNTSGETASVVLLAPTGKTVIVHPPLGTKFAFKTPPQPLDNLEFTGKVVGNDRLMLLVEATLLSQSANTETATEVTAEELTAEFDKDADAASKKYEGKLVKVTGPVNAIGSTGAHLGMRGLELRPPGGKIKAYFVDCFFEGTGREAAKGVKLREKVTVIGRFGAFKKGNGETYTVTLTTCRVDK